MLYNNLDVQIYSKRIKYSTIAETLGITEKTLKKKVHGKTPFTWPETKKIQQCFFPDIPLDILFAEEKAV